MKMAIEIIKPFAATNEAQFVPLVVAKG